MLEFLREDARGKTEKEEGKEERKEGGGWLARDPKARTSSLEEVWREGGNFFLFCFVIVILFFVFCFLFFVFCFLFLMGDDSFFFQGFCRKSSQYLSTIHRIAYSFCCASEKNIQVFIQFLEFFFILFSHFLPSFPRTEISLQKKLNRFLKVSLSSLLPLHLTLRSPLLPLLLRKRGERGFYWIN